MVKSVISTLKTEQASVLIEAVHMSHPGNKLDINNKTGEKVGPIEVML